MKPTKVRNYQIYRATYTTRSKQLGGHLSKDLQKKYGKRSIRITLGDTVKVIRGEYRGVDGKVSKIEMAGNSIAIEGIKKEKSRGEKFDIFIPASNVVWLLCLKFFHRIAFLSPQVFHGMGNAHHHILFLVL